MPPTDRDRAEYERNLITKIQQGWNIGRDTQVSPSLLNKAVTSAPEGSIAQQRAQQYVEAQGPSVARQVSQVQSAPQYTSLIRPSQQAVGAPSPVTPQAGPTISGAAPRAAGPTVAAPSQPNAELYQLLEQQGVYDPTSTQHQQRIAPLLAHLMTQRAGGNTSTRDGGLLSDEEQTLEDFQFLQSMLNTKDDGNFLHDFIGQNIEWIVPAAATAMLGAAGMGFGMPQGAAGAAGGGGAAVTTGAGTAAGGGGVGVGMTPALAGAGGPGAAGYVGAPAVAAAGAGAPGLGADRHRPMARAADVEPSASWRWIARHGRAHGANVWVDRQPVAVHACHCPCAGSSSRRPGRPAMGRDRAGGWSGPGCARTGRCRQPLDARAAAVPGDPGARGARDPCFNAAHAAGRVAAATDAVHHSTAGHAQL
jgi:hypothetical protein